jgi:hypothetical protein
MSHVDWNQILGDRVLVDFSSLEIPERRDEFDKNVAQLRVADDHVIDIAWDNEDSVYVVTMFRDVFESPVARRFCKTPTDVIQMVLHLVDELDNGIRHFSASQTNKVPAYA